MRYFRRKAIGIVTLPRVEQRTKVGVSSCLTASSYSLEDLGQGRWLGQIENFRIAAASARAL